MEEEHNGTTWDLKGTGSSVEAIKGGGGVRLREASRGRKVPTNKKTLGPTGTWAQVKGGKGGSTGQRKAGTGSREDLLWDAWQGREAQTSGGGRRPGASSRWTVASRPGEMGREKMV